MFAALSPASLARRSARHPWLTLAGWLLLVALGGAAAAFWLGDSLTTNNGFTNEPEALQADALIGERFFPPTPRPITEILYIHSDTYTVDDPDYRAFAEFTHDLISDAVGAEAITSATSFFRAGAEQLVSLDRHATAIVFTLVDDLPEQRNLRAYLDTVATQDADPDFELFPLRAPGTSRPEMVIVESETYTVSSDEFRTFVEALFLDIVSLGRSVVTGASTYYAAGDSSLIAADGTATAIPVILNGRRNLDAVLAVIEDARQAADFEISITGSATVDHDFNELSEHDLQQGEFKIGLPSAIVVLILVSGAVIAALVPLIMAVISIAAAMGLAAIIGNFADLSLFLVNIVFMMGLAVGIDYSLFVIARFREERAGGLSVVDAVGKAGATASRAVLFSGVTVVLALSGLLFVPTTIFFSLGLGAILVVVAAILASLTLLPAVLALLGDRVNRLRVPFMMRSGGPQAGSRLWERIAVTVMKAPVLWFAASTALLVAMAIPVFGLHTGASGVSSFPESFESRRGFEVLQEKFATGVITPTDIVVDGDIADPAVRAAVDRLKADIEADDAFGAVTEQVDEAGITAWLRTAVTIGDNVSDAAISAVKRIREDYIPAAFVGVPARALVTGETAGNLDWFEVADAAAPVVIPYVLVLSFVLLMLVFRSVVVPLTAIVLNLLSVGAAYGLLVLVFQQGIGNELFGFQQSDKIEAWIPVLLFAILFGLSMDYQVFLLSRIRERFGETGDNRDSIVFGVRSTSRLITGAALIMVAVFAGFASGELVMFEQMGFGLAVAVLLDATIVRSVLVPALMRILGRWNWYLPGFLQWLPHMNVEGSEPATAAKRRD